MKKATLVQLISLIITVLIIVGIIISTTNNSYFESNYVVEDGLIENLTFLAHLCTAGICLFRYKKLRKERERIFKISLLTVAAIFLFGAGEEISWGQRFFRFESPAYFLTSNSQGEFNVHNLVVFGIKLNKVFFGTFKGVVVVFYFLVLPYLAKQIKWVGHMLELCAIPLPKISLTLLYLVMFLAIIAVQSPKRGELVEFLGAWVFCILIYSPKNISIFESRKNREET